MSEYPPPPTGPPGRPGDIPGPPDSAEPVDALGRPLAAWRQRLGAFVLDEIFVYVISELAKFALGVRHTAGQVLTLLLAAGYYAFLHSSEMGQTFGKRAFGIQVRDLGSGGPVDFRRAGVRFFVAGSFRLIPYFAFFTLLDGLWPLWDRKRQALHDKIAGTLVVRVTESSRPALPGPDG